MRGKDECWVGGSTWRGRQEGPCEGKQQPGGRQTGLKSGSTIYGLRKDPWASVWSHPNSCSVCLRGWGSVDTQDERAPRKLGRVAPTQGAEWGMLTILLMSLIAEGSELLIQGFQRDAHGIVPALPGIEQQAVVS